MRKEVIAVILIIICTAHVSLAQGRFSATVTKTSNVLTFKLKPDVTTTSGFSVIEFFFRYRNNLPAFGYGTVTANTSNFPGMTSTGAANSGSWEIERNNPANLEPGYNVDHFIYTAPAPVTGVRSYTGGTEYELISIPLMGNVPSLSDLQFIHQSSEALYYLAITGEGGNDVRPASPNNYFYPATASTPGPAGSTFYYMDLTNIALPVRFTAFSAVKKDKDAVLTWMVENQDAASSHFEIERSLNGIDFSKIGMLEAIKTGGAATYNFTDRNMTSAKSSGFIFYRLKQVDKDGKFVYSAIRSIRVDDKTLGANLYPNPAKNYIYLTIDLAADFPVTILITDITGRAVKKIEWAGSRGVTQKTIDISALASGPYMFKVNAGDQFQIMPLVKEQ